MDASGLRRILSKMKIFGHPQIDKQIDQYEQRAEVDYEEIIQNFNRDVLRDFQDPWDVFRALLTSVEGSRAHDFFVSAMQHLLLIRQQGEQRVRYFQLIDGLITAVVLDRKAIERDFSAACSKSVNQVVSQFADQSRFQEVEEQTQELKQLVSRLRRDKRELEEEVAKKQEGLVGQLKNQLFKHEEDLAVSRQTTEMLKTKLHDSEKTYKEQLSQQELQIREMFNMLKESRALDDLADSTGVLDRRELLAMMQKKQERLKTIYRLEGRTGQKPPPEEGPWNAFADGVPAERQASGKGGKAGDRDTGKSMYEDADDQAVREQIEKSLTNGYAHLVRGSAFGAKSDKANVRVTGLVARTCWQCDSAEHSRSGSS